MNPLLSRQLRKAFAIESDSELQEWVNALHSNSNSNENDKSNSNELAKLKQGLLTLIPRIEDSYAFSERDMKLKDRSLQISSEELLAANKKTKGGKQTTATCY
ncbi:hypothetical protein KUL42_23690 [Alteromonas sp. KUL42]|uniref:hypothetical protein n=1 Tax=Alteromonas sp. KUL42 TaxID=2480797 RepID=UPI0010FFBE96|nr:hypothetical protein [Alteromonas sp. KUL42]GEA07608.1 hypothetical protein KUL42_23690 [Alteromonas sp. KUL42]